MNVDRLDIDERDVVAVTGAHPIRQPGNRFILRRGHDRPCDVQVDEDVDFVSRHTPIIVSRLPMSRPVKP